MNPKEHLARAEQLLGMIGDRDDWDDTAQITALALEAIAHGLAAVAVELGVPHNSAPAGVISGGG